jgi:hypothetical protein
MKKSAVVLMGAVIIMVLFLFTALGYWTPWTPIPPPTPPGEYTEVTYATNVKASYYWFQPAKLESVQSSQISYSSGVGQPQVALFPFEGKITLEVTYPQGQRSLVGQQKVMIAKGADVTVSFTWKTKQAGTHVVIASLYDLDNNLVDQMSEEVFVPTR